MYKYLITLLTGIVIGALVFFDSAEKILDFFLDRWQMALIIALVMILFAWAIYTFFDKIAQKALGVVVPEYPELVENTFQAVENYREGNKEELSKNLQVLLKKVAAKYGEWRARRFFLGVLLGVVTLLFSIFGSVLLRNQNLLIAAQVKNEQKVELERKIDLIKEALRGGYARDSRSPQELIETYFYHVIELDSLGVIIPSIKLSYMKLNNAILTNLDFSKLFIDNLDFDNLVFENCSFEKSELSYSSIRYCQFNNCNLDSLIADKLEFKNIVFRDTREISFWDDGTYLLPGNQYSPSFINVVFLKNDSIAEKDLTTLRGLGAIVGEEEVIEVVDSLKSRLALLEGNFEESYVKSKEYNDLTYDIEWFEQLLKDEL